MTTEEIYKSLDEISQYFWGCYRNAGGGTRACEKFHDWMCAVDDAKEMIEKRGSNERTTDRQN